MLGVSVIIGSNVYIMLYNIVIPDVSEERSGGSGSNTGLISGVVVAGVLIFITVLVLGVVCALRFRSHSKSLTLHPVSDNITFCEFKITHQTEPIIM